MSAAGIVHEYVSVPVMVGTTAATVVKVKSVPVPL